MSGAEPNAGAKGTGPSVQPAAMVGLTRVAGPSKLKPLFFGFLHLWAAVMLGGPGGILIWIAVTEDNKDRASMAGLGGAFVFMGILFLCAASRRFRVAGDQSVGIQAGPAGIALGVPTNPFFGWFRLKFITRQYVLRWGEISKWYPFVRSVNGITTESALIFELAQGGQINANTMFYDGGRSALVERIEAAVQGSTQA